MVTSSTFPSTRIKSIDLLRGFVMVLMALDHTRDYFTDFYQNPTDLELATTPMFLTRWITHFCAPVFIFLAGSSAYLSLQKKNSKKDATVFLLTRGTWMILLELTLVRFGWQFNFDLSQLFVQVIWAIGWSMIFLSVLIHLPFYALLSFGLLMIFGHNLLDVIQAEDLGGRGWLWHIIHQFGLVQAEGFSVFVIYPLVPWIGVMATGYCFGRVMLLPEYKRRKALLTIGGVAILLFVILRFINVYGDPHPWEVQPTFGRSILSFINCEKYPPSLLYLLMTLGPSILVLPFIEKTENRVTRFFTVFGRVPLFYYLLHIYLIHTMAVLLALAVDTPIRYFIDNELIFGPKPNWGFGLPVVYLVWAVAIAILYYPSRWFMYIKLNHKKWWLSYL